MTKKFSIAYPLKLDIKTCTDPTHQYHPKNHQNWSPNNKEKNFEHLVIVRIQSCNHFDRVSHFDFGYHYFKSHQIDTGKDTKLMCSAREFEPQEFTLEIGGRTTTPEGSISKCGCV